MVSLVKHDLEFILRQIKIAEAHASGTPLTEVRVDAAGNVVTGNAGTLAISNTLLPYGLRTVDGSYNNLNPGRELWGASGQPFVNVLTPEYRDVTGNATITFGAGTPNAVTVTNGNYDPAAVPGPRNTVVDAAPRIISNLIIDQTLENPAAIRAALQQAGLTGDALLAAESEIRTAYQATKTTPDDVTAAEAARDAAIAGVEAAAAAYLELIQGGNWTAEQQDAAIAAINAADQVFDAAEAALLAAQQALTSADSVLAAVLTEHGVEMSGESIVLRNVAPDEGLSAPYNSWFTLFGQFFDHGLDLVKKNSASGTVYIPLQPDDPLYVAGSPTNFMAMTRIDQAEPNNLTTPFVDQNQTYTSHASHQFFLREYVLVDGKPIATGKLLEGANGGLATWGDIKAQAREILGIDLTDDFVHSVPLVKTDQYGNFVPGANGMPQVVFMVPVEPATTPPTFQEDLQSGMPGAPLDITGAARIANAFLDDIAHSAVPDTVFDHDGNPATPMVKVQADTDDVAGNAITTDARGNKVAYDNELLDRHFITGDGRGNENIGLTAVHHVFHSEHNHLVDQVKELVLASGDLQFLNQWLLTPVTEIPANGAGLAWDGERLFQAARFTNEMQYQHLVFEEFARKVQPDVDAFVFNASMDINPAIFAEFAHVVYRFGHSMLNETVDVVNATTGLTTQMELFDAFLNPVAFDATGGIGGHDEAAAAIVRGMTRQVGNEIDEFVTDVLRNQLVGLPLDLAVLNIARGRDAGIPSLNEARRQFQEIAQGDTQLNPYTSWTDFALNLKNPASIVNFIAAYGTHGTIEAADTVAAKRDAAMKLVFGGDGAPADRLDFLNAQGAYAGGSLGGLENIDLWVGGLAEKKMPFGGMLGSTFSFIFELQMENLQNGDRFYYLSRVQGLNLFNELENNSFAKMVMNNTTLGEQDYALPGDIFSTPDHTFYVDRAKQALFGSDEPPADDPVLAALGRGPVERGVVDTATENYLRYNGADHIVVGGTDGDDTIISGGGDDALWGFDGNDRLEAGDGVDRVHGGKGDDIITNSATPIGEVDMLHGEEGNDVIHGGHGLALVFGNQGSDAIITGPDGKEAFGGTDNDFILGGEGGDFLLGNEGDDWIEGGNGFDVIAGDNSELFFNSSIIGHDVMFAGQNENDFDAESGDDIMVQGESVMRSEGMWGYDWAIHKGFSRGADADLTVPIFTTDQAETLRNRFDQVEGLSGSSHGDVLRGDSRSSRNAPEAPGSVESQMFNNELTQAGVNRITGLRELMGSFVAAAPITGDLEKVIAFDRGNILLGGDGSDTIEGRGGDDVIDGDAWLNVKIRIDLTDGGVDFIDSLAEIQAELLSGAINPSQLSIVREISYDRAENSPAATDVAVYSDLRGNYTISENGDGSWTVAHTGGTGADGTDLLRNIELVQFGDGARYALEGLVPLVTPGTDPGPLPPLLNQMRAAFEIEANGPPVFQMLTAAEYTGPVQHLQYQMIATAGNDIVFGTTGNDFINVRAGTDAVNAGAGDDVIDGGTGSNFLSGGGGNDVFFLDGRGGGAPTWSTITDWSAGDQLAIWGWVPGTSKLSWQENAGAAGYQGATLHADLDSNGSIDVSVTWAGRTQAQLPTPIAVASDQLLWFL